MGWAVGWDYEHRRWKGYGVPAYCDALKCREKIDRGLGYGVSTEDDELPDLFVCGKHDESDVDEDVLPPEHPEWLEFLFTDESWAKWRQEEPALLAAWISHERYSG